MPTATQVLILPHILWCSQCSSAAIVLIFFVGVVWMANLFLEKEKHEEKMRNYSAG